MTSQTEDHEDIDDLLSIIEANLVSGKESEASQKFKLLLQKSNDRIPSNIFKWVKNNNSGIIKTLLVEKLHQQITAIVTNSSTKVITLIPLHETDDGGEYVIELLMEAVDSLSEEMIKQLLCGSVIPGMFNTELQNEVHDVLIDFGFQLIEKFPITKLNGEEVKLFTLQLIDKYIKVLEKWREENYSHWHELWMFLVRFSAKHLHTAMDLANKLLRVVEFAFRNPSYEQRLKGYECWKELIDNASLDMKHMCSGKQIKLLMTPLRAKFSKMEVVICKRFEVFLYLLQKLQNNSILCLNEFLEFCFGVSNTNSSSKNGQGKLVPNLWLRSIQVFLAILGDQTHISAEFKEQLFEEAIINEKNFDRFDQVVVYSVIESSTILKIISINFSEKINIYKSLWMKLFELIIKSSKTVQEKCFSRINNSLTTLFKDFNEDITYLSLLNAFLQLMNGKIDYSIYSGPFILLIESTMKFLNEVTVSLDLYQQFEEILMKLCKKRQVLELVTEHLKKVDPTRNEEIIYKLWMNLGLAVVKEDDQSQTTISIFLWPILHLNKCTVCTDNLCSNWVKYFSQTSASTKKIIFNEINKAFRSNPLLSSNISTIISLLHEDGNCLEENIVESLLKLITSISSMPLLSQETTEKLFPLILKCTKMVTANEKVDTESIDNICQCFQKIPANHKNSTSLEALEGLVKKIGPIADTNVGNKLKILMSSFSNTKLQKRASKIASLLSPEGNNTPSSNVKRSIRMTQMVFDKDGSTPNKEKVDALQLFGQDVETCTPFKVKGSLLQGISSTPSTNSRSKRIINSVKKSHLPNPPIIDDPSCEYVVIDTEVKLQKDLLTDHQKESLRRRREDIPALYQDLSQSQTQSSVSTDTQSNNIAVITDKNKNEKDMTKSLEQECPQYKNCQTLEIPLEEKHIIKNVEKVKEIEANEYMTDNNDESENKKIKEILPRSQRELMRIRMDIVGGNSFIENLPSKRPRKTTEKTYTPKKSKKSNSELQISDVTQNAVGSTASVESSIKEDVGRLESEKPGDLPEKDQNTDDNSEIQPVVIIETIPPSGVNSEVTPNRRKNKLMKPIKNFDTPSSEKKTNKSAKKQEKEIIKQKSNRRSKTPSKSEVPESSESEILFESEINMNITEKKKVAAKSKKNNRTSAGDQGIEIIKVKEERDTSISKEETKHKKTSKELMKKNKQKVRTIQSQLKLANLSNLEVSAEKKVPKNAKLIFIRELTNSKNPQDTKVAPAGLKRNKDNISKNIAYTIETPTNSVEISSLVNMDDTQPSQSEPSISTDYINMDKAKSNNKRKRKSSENNISVESSSPEKNGIDLELKEIMDDDKDEGMKQNDIEENTTATGQCDEKNCDENLDLHTDEMVNNKKRKKCARKSSKENHPSSDSSMFSPESPSRSTRSSMNSPMGDSVDFSNKQVSPKGVRILFKDSEDIIESSQGSFIENTSISISIGNLSRSKVKQSPKIQNGPEEIDNIKSTPDENPIADPPPQIDKVVESPNAKNEKSVSQATTLTCESNYEVQPCVLQVEIQEKQELSDSEKLLSIADTVSIESTTTGEIIQKENNEEPHLGITGCENIVEQIVEKTINKDISDGESPVSNKIQIETFGTPQKNGDKLPGSPVSQATPTFKKELLDNTLDISPIGSLGADSDDQKDIIEALDAAIGEKSTYKEAELTSSNSRSLEDNKIQGTVLSSNERSNKLLNMVNVESPISTHKKISKRKLASPALRKTRYEKLFSFYRSQDNGDIGNREDGSLTCTEKPEDILTFTREVPSPLAVPSSSILKRKLADTDDSYSPCPKRKRVNFSYPCITSTKLFIRHKDELNTHFKPVFATNLFDDDPQQDSEEEDPFAEPESYGQVGTEESMEIANSLLLCSNKPIDQRLINCNENVDRLLKRLTSPMYCDKLRELLKNKNIETIGDLASLNEIEVNRLPFKDPKVKTVKRALSYYLNILSNESKKKEEKNINVENSSSSSGEEKDKTIDVGNDNNTQSEKIQTEIKNDITPQPENLCHMFRILITKLKEKGSSLEEFGEIFIDLVDESDVVNLLENVYNTNFRKFFGKPHWRYLVENIVKMGGTLELFDIISDLAENNTVFADQLEHIVQVRIDQDPLKNILKKKTLVQLGAALKDCIEEGEFPRENVLQTCLMPLIKCPSDIRNYFNSLTIVQIHDLFIERVQPSDLTCFFDQIKEHYGNYTVAQCANKQDVLKICSKEDLAGALIAKENEVGAVKHLISHIRDERKLLELYNYIGDLLPFKSRIDSHIDLLKSIPFNKIQD